MDISSQSKTALVTGVAGFIGYHIARKLLENGWRVIGIDSMSTYYDVSLKINREKILLESKNYKSIHSKIETPGVLLSIFEQESPDIIIHLAAQAGVRYSIENPRSYLESNVVGTFELLEAARLYPPKHMLLASTSSAYGANRQMPYKETNKADHQVSFYAATKKATENIAHSYSHLFDMPITMFRFFTVYGPWGRPDMALFKFTKAILDGTPIDVYNNGEMTRDFTYIDDLVEGIKRLIECIPSSISNEELAMKNVDSISSVAPFRVVNIGNSSPTSLMEFIDAIENELGVKAEKNFMVMQQGDMKATWANVDLLNQLVGYIPETKLSDGVSKFVKWYRCYYTLSH
ncbi:GDP-mannose 4,6-dehydratase [Amylibacter sp.]|nr:GDP-mannose 4,6-dehydratase [Amylibacter sp.]MDB2537307.1 GDP-mannose 4,6-dehydratase [Amylibacter sp.]MDC1041468.1 GDP-mannose 4,6-dehydratase [Amylibacter sp.]